MKLTKHSIDEFLTRLSVESEKLAAYRPRYRLHYLEARYTLFCLNQILSSKERSIETRLTDFLNERWERIKNTDIQYLHDFTNPANGICIEIARGLGKTICMPYLALLMPSLRSVRMEDYTTSSYADEVNLQDIILSDDNRRMIHIPDILDFAQVDGVLKHNSLYQKKALPLTERETARCLSRHESVRAAYEAIQARVTFKTSMDTVGAALKSLIHGLREGGVKKLGVKHDYDSGADANTAILDFSLYLETLDPAIKQQLMDASKFDRFTKQTPEGFTVDMYWQRLARPNGVKYKDTAYCVEVIANGLEEILDENPFLYELLSYDGEIAVSLDQLDKAISQTRETMSHALPTLEKQHFYGIPGDDALCLHLLPKVEKDAYFPLEVGDIVCVAKKYAFFTKQGIVHHPVVNVAAQLLMNITEYYDPLFVTEVLKGLSVTDQQQFFNLTGVGLYHPTVREQSPAQFFPRSAREKRKAGDDHYDVHEHAHRP